MTKKHRKITVVWLDGAEQTFIVFDSEVLNQPDAKIGQSAPHSPIGVLMLRPADTLGFIYIPLVSVRYWTVDPINH